MKVKSSKPKGQRIFKSMNFKYSGATKSKRPFWIEVDAPGWWFDCATLKWSKNPKSFGGLTTTYYSMKHLGLSNAYSLKAVKRLIRKWDAPKGTVFKASLPFIGYDFYITK